MIYHATNLITEAFDKKHIKYHVEETNRSSCVAAGYGISGGPSVLVRFISRDNDNDVAVRVFSVINEVPKEKELEMLRACSKINCDSRYIKFYMNPDDGDINLEYDFPMETTDDCVGEFAFEMFVRFCRVLREEYHTLAQIVYEGGFKPKDKLSELHDLFEKLKALRENPIVIDETGSDVIDADDSDIPAPSLDLDDVDWFSDFDIDDEAI